MNIAYRIANTKFWSPETNSYLESLGRQDLIDRGNDLAERVTALILTSQNRLEQYIKHGDLFNNKGGVDLINAPIEEIEYFVNIRLRQEIDSLNLLLDVFNDKLI